MQRRQFLQTAAVGFPAVLASRGTLRAAEFDLVIRGGRVIDPAQKIDRIADVAIRGTKIAAIAQNIAASIGSKAAAQTIDAHGKLVVPGLIDMHVHARDAALPPAENLQTGVTTLVDAGSRGADNIDQLVEIARAAPNRMRILLNIARLGNNPQHGEFLDGIEPADVAKCSAAAQKHREWVIGIKARLSKSIAGDLDVEVLRRAIAVAGPLKLPVMIHIGGTASPLPKLLAILRPGDVVTHLYTPENGILDARGRLLPEVVAARKRGIFFDFGNGLHDHWAWQVAESGFKQGFLPDTITSDLTIEGRTDQVIDLPNVMSKFLVLGMSLNEVIARVSSRASRVFHELNPYGSLRTGAAADVTVLELTKGNFEFVDNFKVSRTGSQKLVTREVVMGGKRVV